MLVRCGEPNRVGVKQKEENHADGHHVHVDQQDHPSVIPAPFRTHTAEMVDGAGGGGKGGKNDEGIGVVVREVREEESDSQTEEDQ